MYSYEAIRILGLSLSDRFELSAIVSAWKRKIRHTHPDKNGHTPDATENTQRLNEAKDVLVKGLHDPMEKEAAEKKREEDTRKYYKDRHNKLFEEIKAQKRARYALNRKKRAPGTRVHRKSQDCAEGIQLIEAMKGFIKGKFQESTDFNDIVMVDDILTLFTDTRELSTDMEKNQFRRHARTLIQNAFPKASYTVSQNKRCYRFIDTKK
jgi:curved DNA-binding protein CbpA